MNSPYSPGFQPQRNGPPLKDFGNEQLQLELFILLVGIFFVYSRFPEILGMVTGIQVPGLVAIPFILAAFGALLKGMPVIQTAFSGVTGIFLTFTIWMLICVPFSSWRGGSVEMLRYQWGPVFLCTVLAATILREERHFHILGKVMACASLTIVIAGFYLGRYSDADGRFMFLVGSLKNSNDLSTLLCTGLPFFFIPLLGKEWGLFGKVIALPAIAFHILVVLRTGSRACMFSLLLITLMLFVFSPVKRKLVILAIAVVMIGASLTLTPDVVIARLKSGFGKQDERVGEAIASQRQRLDKLLSSIELTIRRPLFGVGPGTYLSAQAQVDTDAGRRADWLASHNTLTQVSSETGILGLLIYGAAIVVAFSRLQKARKLCLHNQFMQSELNIATALEISLGGIFAANMFGSNAYMFFMPMLMCMGDAFHSQVQRKYAALRPEKAAIPVSASTGIPSTPMRAPSAMPMMPDPLRRPMSKFRAEPKHVS